MIFQHRRSTFAPLLGSTSMRHTSAWSGRHRPRQCAGAIDAASFACAFCSCRKPPRASQRLLLTRPPPHDAAAQVSYARAANMQHCLLRLLVRIPHPTTTIPRFQSCLHRRFFEPSTCNSTTACNSRATWRRQLHEMRCSYCRAGSRRPALIFTAHLLSFLLANCRPSSFEGASMLHSSDDSAVRSLHDTHSTSRLDLQGETMGLPLPKCRRLYSSGS
jgi:hypothetical protein